jgi:hypothetical protein
VPSDPETVPFGHDASWFPAELEFREPDPAAGGRAGVYRGTGDDGQTFVVWDAGSWRLDADGLTLSIANDDLVTYAVDLSEDELTIHDELGGHTTYQRAG